MDFKSLLEAQQISLMQNDNFKCCINVILSRGNIFLLASPFSFTIFRRNSFYTKFNGIVPVKH